MGVRLTDLIDTHILGEIYELWFFFHYLNNYYGYYVISPNLENVFNLYLIFGMYYKFPSGGESNS